MTDIKPPRQDRRSATKLKRAAPVLFLVGIGAVLTWWCVAGANDKTTSTSSEQQQPVAQPAKVCTYPYVKTVPDVYGGTEVRVDEPGAYHGDVYPGSESDVYPGAESDVYRGTEVDDPGDDQVAVYVTDLQGTVRRLQAGMGTTGGAVKLDFQDVLYHGWASIDVYTNANGVADGGCYVGAPPSTSFSQRAW